MAYYLRGEKVESPRFDTYHRRDLAHWLRKFRHRDIHLVVKNETCGDWCQATLFLKGTAIGQFSLLAHVKKGSERGNAFLKAFEGLSSFNATAFRVAVVWQLDLPEIKAKDAKLTMYRPGFEEPDSSKLEYTGQWTASAIQTWAKENMYGTVNRFFADRLWTPQQVFDRYKKGLVAVLLHEGDGGTTWKPKMLEQLKAIPAAFPGWETMLLDAKDLGEDYFDYFRHRQDVGFLRGHTFIAVLHWERGLKYHNGDLSAIPQDGSVATFLQKCIDKKVAPVRKSAPRPTNPVNEHGITILTGDNFEDYVMDPEKDVIVAYTNLKAQCDWCTKFDPVWASMGKFARDNTWLDRGVVLATFDQAENECEEEIDRIPKIILYPAGKAKRKLKDKVILSDHFTNLEHVKAFVEDNAKNLDPEYAPTKSKGKGKKSEL